MKKFILYYITVLSMVSATGWYSNTWFYRREIMLDRQIISGELTNFPWLMVISNDADLSNYASNNGHDILFTDSSGTNTLFHEIEYYSNGTLYAWVKIPILSSTSNTNPWTPPCKCSNSNVSTSAEPARANVTNTP